MPVQKFRSIEEMNTAPLPQIQGDPIERFLNHCALFRDLAPRVLPRGVFKFRTLAEAQAAREFGYGSSKLGP